MSLHMLSWNVLCRGEKIHECMIMSADPLSTLLGPKFCWLILWVGGGSLDSQLNLYTRKGFLMSNLYKNDFLKANEKAASQDWTLYKKWRSPDSQYIGFHNSLAINIVYSGQWGWFHPSPIKSILWGSLMLTWVWGVG